jgi:hypothetical protein
MLGLRALSTDGMIVWAALRIASGKDDMRLRLKSLCSELSRSEIFEELAYNRLRWMRVPRADDERQT